MLGPNINYPEEQKCVRRNFLSYNHLIPTIFEHLPQDFIYYLAVSCTMAYAYHRNISDVIIKIAQKHLKCKPREINKQNIGHGSDPI